MKIKRNMRLWIQDNIKTHSKPGIVKRRRVTSRTSIALLGMVTWWPGTLLIGRQQVSNSRKPRRLSTWKHYSDLHGNQLDPIRRLAICDIASLVSRISTEGSGLSFARLLNLRYAAVKCKKTTYSPQWLIAAVVKFGIGFATCKALDAETLDALSEAWQAVGRRQKEIKALPPTKMRRVQNHWLSAISEKPYSIKLASLPRARKGKAKATLILQMHWPHYWRTSIWKATLVPKMRRWQRHERKLPLGLAL